MGDSDTKVSIAVKFVKKKNGGGSFSTKVYNLIL
jgi:hypothetical protein